MTQLSAAGKELGGSLVALVTPMRADGEIDLAALRRLVDFHAAAGSDGLVIAGTTGESPTLNHAEHCELIARAVECAAGRLPIIAGTGANSTHEAIELTRCAQAAGAYASLSVVPYYNKPTQDGLYRHFRAVAEASDLPQILYNVPGRTGCDLANDTALKLAEIPNVVGVKDATGGIERGTDLLLRAPQGFRVFSGDDATSLALLLLGGHGVISVTANVAPRLMRELCAAASTGDVARARALNARLFGLHRHLFVEANPIPVKWALARMGLIGESLRLPLTPLSPAHQGDVERAMRTAGALD